MFYYLFRGQEVHGEPPTYKKTFNMHRRILCSSVSSLSSAPLLVTTSRELKNGKWARPSRSAPVKRDLNKVPFFVPDDGSHPKNAQAVCTANLACRARLQSLARHQLCNEKMRFRSGARRGTKGEENVSQVPRGGFFAVNAADGHNRFLQPE